MTTLPDRHPSEDDLEHYSLEMLPDEKFWEISTHLNDCAECSARLEQLAPLAREFHNGTERLTQAPPLTWRECLRLWLEGPVPRRLMVAAPAVAVLAIAVAARPWEAAGPPVPVTLQASRGPETSPPVAPSGRQVRLVLDTAGLEGITLSRLELVDVSGRQVFNSAAAGAPVVVKKKLAPGRYWVRLYAGSASAPLREYGLEIR